MSRSKRCQPASIKLQEIVIFSTFHSWCQHKEYQPSQYYVSLYRGHSTSTSLGKGEGEDKESNRRLHRKEGVQSKKDVPHTISSTYFFFCNSIFPSWFLMKLSHYIEQEEELMQERACQYI